MPPESCLPTLYARILTPDLYLLTYDFCVLCSSFCLLSPVFRLLTPGSAVDASPARVFEEIEQRQHLRQKLYFLANLFDGFFQREVGSKDNSIAVFQGMDGGRGEVFTLQPDQIEPM